MTEAEAAVAILHARGVTESVLLMRRADRDDDPWSGHWSFPGGRCGSGDADLLDTAIRELHEECGVEVDRERMEMALPVSNARRKAGPLMRVAPFVFGVDSELNAVADDQEAVEARWFPLHLLRDPQQHRLAPIPRLPSSLLFPCIPLPEMPLWGFTYRLITEWLKLLPAGSTETLEDITNRLAGASASEVEGLLSGPWERIPAVTMVELDEEGVRVTGLNLKEYWIPFSKSAK